MKPMERISVIDHVVGEIRKLITSGEVTPGEKLPTEKELCESLQVGRSSVREAFRMLQATGHVEMVPGKGAYAARQDFEEASIRGWFAAREADLNDYMDVRLALEPYAAKLAAGRAGEKDKEALVDLAKKYREAAASSDGGKLALYDEAFHKQIIFSTCNRLLIRISEAVFRDFAQAVAKVISVAPNTDEAIFYHESLLDAIRNKDALESERIMREHLRRAQRDIANLSKPGKEGGGR